jgi:hypothetical protein
MSPKKQLPFPMVEADAGLRQPRGAHKKLVSQVIHQIEQIEPNQMFEVAVDLIAGRKFETFRALVNRAAKQLGITPPAVRYDKANDRLLIQKL